MEKDQRGIIIRNITQTNNDSDIINSLYDLFNNFMQKSTPRDNIVMKKDESQNKYACVFLKSDDEVTEALNSLKDKKSRNKLHFKFNQIADSAVDIVVLAILPKLFYRIGEQIGNENRKREFKKGGGMYVYEHLRRDISKYVCGFLNGRIEGTLFIGVEENESGIGIVCGVDLDKTEDEIRRNYIDTGIGDIKPTLHTDDYTVKVVPVEQNGQIKAQCKVIEITVYKKKKFRRFYETKNNLIYLRRDGGTHELKGGQVQDLLLNIMPESKVCVIF